MVVKQTVNQEELYLAVHEIAKVFQSQVHLEDILASLSGLLKASLFLVDHQQRVLYSKTYAAYQHCPLFLQKTLWVEPSIFSSDGKLTDACLFATGCCIYKAQKVITAIPLHAELRQTRYLIVASSQTVAQKLVQSGDVLAIFFNALLQNKVDQKEDQRRYNKRRMTIALKVLTYSEKDVLREMVAQFKREKALQTIKTQEIAAHSGVSPSLAQKALTKLQSAGILECHTRGSQGVIIKVINPFLWEAFM